MTIRGVDKLDVALVASTLVAAGTAGISTLFIHGDDGAKRPWVMVLQITALVLTACLPMVVTIRAKRAERDAEARETEVRVESRVEMNQGLDPIVRKLSVMSATMKKRDRDVVREQVLDLVLAAASQIVCPHPKARACFFQLKQGPPKTLAPVQNIGRVGSPRSTFVEGTDAGDAAIKLVETNGERTCFDVSKDYPPGWQQGDRDYGTFISVAVFGRDTGYGMLTVDAPEPGSLTRDDLNVLRVLAGLLATSCGAFFDK